MDMGNMDNDLGQTKQQLNVRNLLPGEGFTLGLKQSQVS